MTKIGQKRLFSKLIFFLFTRMHFSIKNIAIVGAFLGKEQKIRKLSITISI